MEYYFKTISHNIFDRLIVRQMGDSNVMGDQQQEQENNQQNGSSALPAVIETGEERISDIKFEPIGQSESEYIKPIRMHFKRRGRQLLWDMAFEHDNVAVVIYHTERKKLLLVKQFRPPVFIHAVRTKPENAGRALDKIDWNKYPVDLGETLELCAGLMDKTGKSSLEHVQEEMLEECGYRVPKEKIESIKRYITGISISGAAQHLFYAEIDESMRVTEGGGCADEGEFIRKVFLDISEVRALLDQENIVAPPSMMYALSWWLAHKYPKLNQI